MNSSVLAAFGNVSIWSAVCGWLAAQFTKMLCGFGRTHRLDFSYIVSTGGMPSAHAATSSALAVSLGLNVGFDSPVFAMGLGFALLTMFDASTVRRAAGQQARLLNEIVDEIFKHHRLSEQKLAEFLGHTRLEVFLGMVIGVLTALIVNAVAILKSTGSATSLGPG